MKSESFVYWLQGLFELAEPKTLNEKQTELIRRHLNLVFAHEIDPALGDDKHQAILNAVHQGKTEIEEYNKPPFRSNGNNNILLKC